MNKPQYLIKIVHGKAGTALQSCLTSSSEFPFTPLSDSLPTSRLTYLTRRSARNFSIFPRISHINQWDEARWREEQVCDADSSRSCRVLDTIIAVLFSLLEHVCCCQPASHTLSLSPSLAQPRYLILALLPSRSARLSLFGYWFRPTLSLSASHTCGASYHRSD